MKFAKKKRKGQALVEFAMVVIPFILLLMGIVHGYFVFRAYTALGDAAEVGAETAAIFGGEVPEVGEAIQSSLDGDWVRMPYVYQVILPDAQPGDPPGQAHVGDRIIVQVEYTAALRFVFFDVTPRPQQALRFAERDYGW